MRFIRFLPVLIPIVTGLLRNARVRSVLHLAPLPADGSTAKR